jgi:murein L,D-transpeptidase YafK
MATGKKAGNKIYQGDHRTPEGIYYLTNFLTHQDLLKKHGKQGEIYGVGAFVLNYPNAGDAYDKKTGGGIWLHSTNDETRIDKGLDSRGCVVSGNTDLIEISKYIELHKTPMIVVHNLNYLDQRTWTSTRNQLNEMVFTWLDAWTKEDIDKYISFYHERFRNNHVKGRSALKAYKRSIFFGKGKPKINIKNLNIFVVDNYARITFTQEYESQNIQDIGRKTLYLKRDAYYQWKILAENWSKNGTEIRQNLQTAFKPSQRFFTTNNPKQILGDKLLHAKNTAN